jgi:hypothetical protein
MLLWMGDYDGLPVYAVTTTNVEDELNYTQMPWVEDWIFGVLESFP